MNSDHVTPPMHPPMGLFTDYYELTMAQAYHHENMNDTAVFELFFREMPRERNYIVAAGLEDVLRFLESWRIDDEEIDFLRDQAHFSPEFLGHLGAMRFTGNVYAMPEGTPALPREPLIQVEAPIQEAQLLETFILNQVHFQSVVASKAARVTAAADGRTVVDFGSRRAHGIDGAMKAARASYLAGAAGTSNAAAGMAFGIPLFGTMAHSYVEAHDREECAFREFAALYPDSTLLVDTYDTLEGVRSVINLRRRHGEAFSFRAIRLDSGNLGALACESRSLLDAAGLNDVRIFVSGGLDEHRIAELLSQKAPVDGFGVGTSLVVSDDAPSLDMAYKITSYAGKPRLKLSEDKATLPGRKQVFRSRKDGRMTGDEIGLHDEPPRQRLPLLVKVMENGRRTMPATTLDQARHHARNEIASLPDAMRSLETAGNSCPAATSNALDRLQKVTRQRAAAGGA